MDPQIIKLEVEKRRYDLTSRYSNTNSSYPRLLREAFKRTNDIDLGRDIALSDILKLTPKYTVKKIN